MKTLILLPLSILLVVSLQSFKPSQVQRKKIFQAPPKEIVHYHFGYSDMLSSMMWVRLLQDIEVCDQRDDRDVPKKIDTDKDVIHQILTRELPPAKCERGWVYKMVDVITDLDPDFYMAYEVGALFLSVLVDDREGAHLIYNKGLKKFPEDWEIHYKASYHTLFEMQNPDEAAVLLKKAGDLGAPQWTYSLAARLYTDLGQAQLAKTILERVLERNPTGVSLDRIQKRLVEVNKVLEKHQ